MTDPGKSFSRGIWFISCCIAVAIILNGLFTVWSVHNYQQQQRRQGREVLSTLCHTLDGLASLKPPAGSAAANPSRAYLQQEHDRLAQLGKDIGCPT